MFPGYSDFPKNISQIPESYGGENSKYTENKRVKQKYIRSGKAHLFPGGPKAEGKKDGYLIKRYRNYKNLAILSCFQMTDR